MKGNTQGETVHYYDIEKMFGVTQISIRWKICNLNLAIKFTALNARIYK
jgi:hypothetical protein